MPTVRLRHSIMPSSSAKQSSTKFLVGFGHDRFPWADPAQSQPGEINHHDDGRGFYFKDPDGHFLEVITRPYGSRGYNP